MEENFKLVNKEYIENTRASKLISICIPVYNRIDIFRGCLICACESCLGYELLSEIVVSNNASEQDIYSVVKEVSIMYPSVDIFYNCNLTNIGMAANFVKSTSGAIGDFCWIIGSDDFIKKNSINTIINILTHNQDIDFISCSFDLISIDNMVNIYERLKDSACLRPACPNLESFKVEKLDYIIDPRLNNVLLGSIMAGIFRRSVWNQVKITDKQLEGFNCITNIYPHVYIYANGFLGRKAYYCGEALVTVGEGNREWSVDTGSSYWDSSLPVIYFKTFAEIAKVYKDNGLDMHTYTSCENWLASFSGDILVPIIWKKYVTKEPVNSIDSISPLDTISILGNNPIFRQTALNKLRQEFPSMQSQYEGMEKTPIGNILINLYKNILENY